MPFINTTKRSRDLREYSKCTNFTNCRSRVGLSNSFMDRPRSTSCETYSTQLTPRSIKPKNTPSEGVCLYQNSSTLQISHQVPRNLEKMPSKKHKITRSSFKQIRIEKYITPLASSILTNRSRVWPVHHLYQIAYLDFPHKIGHRCCQPFSQGSLHL